MVVTTYGSLQVHDVKLEVSDKLMVVTTMYDDMANRVKLEVPDKLIVFTTTRIMKNLSASYLYDYKSNNDCTDDHQSMRSLRCYSG